MDTPGDLLPHEVAEGIKNAPLKAAVRGLHPLILTIGHSSMKLEDFLVLLVEHGVRRLVDVRSTPYSKYRPQFNKDSLRVACAKVGIHYHWYGRILGGRNTIAPSDTEFRHGMDQILKMAEDRQTPAMMCSELDPAKCHRAYKLAAYLHRYDTEPVIKHITRDGLVDSMELEDSLPVSWLDNHFGGEH
jgi:uncharacterized protein (DUF488 family)